jgi:hypothetical protein
MLYNLAHQKLSMTWVDGEMRGTVLPCGSLLTQALFQRRQWGGFVRIRSWMASRVQLVGVKNIQAMVDTYKTKDKIPKVDRISAETVKSNL